MPRTNMLQTQLRIQEQSLVLLGVNLTDAREEMFIRMVCDGIAVGIAFTKAGFKAASHAALGVAASKLFHLPRIQQRAAAILEARRTQGVVTLPEVTDMLHRVYAKALHDDQLNAAHNAAFSLARLYGHVTDRAIVETVRKPSRDPDAPAERSLSNWIDALPVRAPLPGFDAAASVLSQSGQGSGLETAPETAPEKAASLSPRAAVGQGSSPALASPGNPYSDTAGLEPSDPYSDTASPYSDTASPYSDTAGLEPSGPKPLISQGLGLGDGRRQSGNGAPVGPVTGTPPARGRSALLSSSVAQLDKRRRAVEGSSPRNQKQGSKRKRVPVLSGAQKRKRKRMKELFG